MAQENYFSDRQQLKLPAVHLRPKKSIVDIFSFFSHPIHGSLCFVRNGGNFICMFNQRDNRFLLLSIASFWRLRMGFSLSPFPFFNPCPSQLGCSVKVYIERMENDAMHFLSMGAEDDDINEVRLSYSCSIHWIFWLWFSEEPLFPWSFFLALCLLIRKGLQPLIIGGF